MRNAQRISMLQGEQLEARQMLTVPDFALPDINDGSESFGDNVSPRDYMGEVTAWYFIRSFCSYCRSQSAFLRDLQVEFERNYPSLDVSILIVDDKGATPANEELATGVAQDLPFLRDTGVAWSSWQAAWRDVKVVNRSNEFGPTLNLTANNLATPEAYATLKEMIIDVAKRTPASAHQSPIEPLDVNNDSTISPIDALGVINELGKHPGGALPILQPGQQPLTFVDVSGDGSVAPNDALAVINHLNVLSRMDQGLRAPLSSSSVTYDADVDALPPVTASQQDSPTLARQELAGVMLEEVVVTEKVDHAVQLAASRAPMNDWRLGDARTDEPDESKSLFDVAVVEMAAF